MASGNQSPSDAVLWTSDVPKYGVVRVVVIDGRYAATFDDLNGDGHEIQLNVWIRDADGWGVWAHRDDVRLLRLETRRATDGRSRSTGSSVVTGQRVDCRSSGEMLARRWS